jgi:N-acetylneuraminate synthase
MINRDVFDELFVLELANNHWGDLQRGLRIVKEFSTVVRYNDVRAAIKLQFRDVENFIHKDFVDRNDIRYVKKTLDTRLTKDEMATLVEAVRRNNCIRMATPFDEASVELCEELGIEIIKIASSDITDWPLLERIAKTRKPVIVSTGGASIRSMDAMVTFFENRHIPLAINHCVSLYPTEDAELELNQIDFLRRRYPNVTIGFSTHEYHDWTSSVMMAYAKGARTFERHIDIDTSDHPISPYCSTPEQIAVWFRAFHKAKEMCGGSPVERRRLPAKEVEYLDGLVRGVYARRDLPVGHVLTNEDYYLAIPLQKGQLSCRELITGDPLVVPIAKDQPITIEAFDTPYARPGFLHEMIANRGIDTPATQGKRQAASHGESGGVKLVAG